MNRALRAAMVAFALVAALAIAACGNEEQNDYVDQVNAAQTEFVDEMTAVAQAPPTSPGQIDQLITDMQSTIESFTGDLEGIEAPDDVADLHDQLITSMAEIGDQLGELSTGLQSGDPQELAAAATELAQVATKAQTDLTNLIAQINSELQD